MKTTATNIKAGDILAGVYHYSMTIPHFYQVTKVTPSGCKVVEMDSQMVRSADGPYHQQGWMMPVPNTFTREKQARRTGAGEWKIGSRYDSMYLYVWDGKPMYADFCD